VLFNIIKGINIFTIHFLNIYSGYFSAIFTILADGKYETFTQSKDRGNKLETEKASARHITWFATNLPTIISGNT
jgi:hypothetical protein